MEKYVIFDLDGTLNQTDLYAVEAYKTALSKRGRNIERDEIIACIGLSPADIIKKLFGSLNEEETTAWSSDIRELEFNFMEKKARVFDGVHETLQMLKDKGYGLAICSNAFPAHIEHVLEVLHIRTYFDLIGSLDLGKTKSDVLGQLLKEIVPAHACMAGDRKFDLEAARANGIPFIGCAYGYAPGEIQKADIIIHKFGELTGAAEALI